VQGRILAVLAETTAELNLRTIARLSRVSPAQASRVLPGLVELGIVERREAPPSALFTLVPDHVGGRLVRALSRCRETVLVELGALAGDMEPSPTCVVIFGSLARGEADARSDVDVLFVRPADVDEDDEPWGSAVEDWRAAARRLTGNPVQIIELDSSGVAGRIRRPTAFWSDVLRDGVVVHGPPLEALRDA